ncbi:MAG: YHS domain-containing protein, partial [Deltaproteobacteria bacterium]|nr:YHS domain-containing protein [Deltaproteobacteria bacterium]
MRDPVCGMDVALDAKGGTTEWQGETYSFCSEKCRKKFTANPDAYLHPQPQTADPAEASRQYTCPMHPEIVQQGPGSCPKCGMDLEPLSASGDDSEEEEAAIRSLKRKTIFAGVLTLPIMFLAFDSMIPGLSFEGVLSVRLQGWLELILATPVILWAGSLFFTRGWHSLINRSLNMFTLIMLGVGAAY